MDLLAIAKNAADRVEAASVANKVPVAVCVIDVHGNVVDPPAADSLLVKMTTDEGLEGWSERGVEVRY